MRRRASAMLVTLAIGAAACTAILDTSAAQCESDGDCRERGGAFSTSVCRGARCIAAENAPCTTNKECAAALGVPAICRKRDGRCGKLLSPECSRLVGDPTNEDAIVLGTIFTVTGTNGPSGVDRQKAAEAAIEEIRLSVGGIPAGARPRPLALVSCDDNLDSVAPATHLVDDVGVPAIIGIASSTRVTEVATKVTIPKRVLLISPTATSVAITTLRDDNLVWRTAPSDALQSLALVDQLPAIEATYRAANATPEAEKLHASFVYLAEAYGIGLYEAVATRGQLNGKPLTDPANAGAATGISFPVNPPNLDAQVDAVLAQSPRPAIIAGFGSTELLTKFVAPLEAKWGDTSPKPHYLFADATRKVELLDMVARDPSLRARVRGSVPAAPVGSPAFASFKFKFEGMFQGASATATFGMAGTYDSVFLLGYAIAAAGDGPLGGETLAKNFGRLVSGTKIEVGGANMNAGFQALVSPGTFDFDGASGPLDFDLATGEAPSNIDIWCVTKDTTGRPAFASSGRVYDATKSAMVGTFDVAVCAKP